MIESNRFATGEFPFSLIVFSQTVGRGDSAGNATAATNKFNRGLHAGITRGPRSRGSVFVRARFVKRSVATQQIRAIPSPVYSPRSPWIFGESRTSVAYPDSEYYDESRRLSVPATSVPYAFSPPISFPWNYRVTDRSNGARNYGFVNEGRCRWKLCVYFLERVQDDVNYFWLSSNARVCGGS